MANSNPTADNFDFQQVTDGILKNIDQEREREIIIRRFGLTDRRETLEQIGEFLGITRERVRQLEKAISIRLKIAAENKDIPGLPAAEKMIIRHLVELGRTARVNTLAAKLKGCDANATEQSQLAFIAEIGDQLTLLDENDFYFQSVSITEDGDRKALKTKIDEIVNTIKTNKQVMTLSELDAKLDYQHPQQIEALALSSKKLATLNGTWGLIKWPTVNPKNIKDKIYVVLSQNKKPMHFSEIDQAIKNSDFKRRDVTKQAIHNELIKDNRFVLIGRGIYALAEWGYERGTVADTIADVLKKSKQPMYRDDIIKHVLKLRRVKETTVLLNLQSRPEFKRVAKATYIYQDPKQA